MIGLNDGSVDAFFMADEYGFSSVGSWCYLREWVWNSRAKLCSITLGKTTAESHYMN